MICKYKSSNTTSDNKPHEIYMWMKQIAVMNIIYVSKPTTENKNINGNSNIKEGNTEQSYMFFAFQLQ